MPFHVNTGLFEVQAARSCIEVSERMSCEQSAIFLPNPAYIPHTHIEMRAKNFPFIFEDGSRAVTGVK